MAVFANLTMFTIKAHHFLISDKLIKAVQQTLPKEQRVPKGPKGSLVAGTWTETH